MRFLFFTAIIVSYHFAFAQNELKVQTSATYTTDFDQEMTIRKIAVLPTSDNTNGIYSRQAEEELKSILKSDHRFQLVDSQFVGTDLSPEELETNPGAVQQILENIDTDAAIASRIVKQPDGMDLHVSLFLKKDGKLLARDILKEKNTFDVKQVRAKIKNMLARVLKQLPYDGVILSRQQTLVTVNLGKKNGIEKGQIVTAILLIKANRHPKLNFIISSEKEVLGKIRLDKVDDTISFGQILTEKDFGSIQRATKISGIDFVTHSPEPLDGAFKDSPEQAKQNQIAFGNNPKEWVPVDPPSFGKIGVAAGLGRARYTATTDAGEGKSIDDGYLVNVNILGELWITQQWIADITLQQGITTGDPNMNIQNYELGAGYNFLVRDEFFGPSVLLSLGLSSYTVDVPSSSGLLSTKYSGLFLRLKGFVPITPDKKWNLGGMLQYHFKADYTDSPSSGGGDDATITKFSLMGFYQANIKYRFTGSIDFSAFSTNLSDESTLQDSSQKFTALTGGIEFLF